MQSNTHHTGSSCSSRNTHWKKSPAERAERTWRRHGGGMGRRREEGGGEGQQVEGADKTHERRGRIRKGEVGSYANGEAGRRGGVGGVE